jgi:hypothetical protein
MVSMDALSALRMRARARRDAAIAIARAEYARVLRDIRVLSDDDQAPTAVSLIEELIPPRPFNLYEMIGWFREVNPGSTLQVATLRQALMRLAERGVLKRMGNDRDGLLVWAPANWTGKPNDVGYVKAITGVLGDVGPLKASEIAVVLRVQGYRADLTDRELLTRIQVALTQAPRTFAQDEDGRWALLTVKGSAGR